MTHKRCSKCGATKLIECFHSDDGRRRSECGMCRQEMKKQRERRKQAELKELRLLRARLVLLWKESREADYCRFCHQVWKVCGLR